jgi:uncharacterized protein (TIGR01615 family)
MAHVANYPETLAEVQESAISDWLSGYDVSDDMLPKRESATTAFWRSIAVRHDKVIASPSNPNLARRRIPTVPTKISDVSQSESQDLVQLGHLVDEFDALFPDPRKCHDALVYALTLTNWTVTLCSSKCTANSPFRGMPFLHISPPSKTTKFVVDLNFSEKFHAARPSRRLSSLLKAAPKAFVGTRDTLVKSIRWCAGVVQESIMHAGMDVPPWRTGTHLQQSYTQHEVMDTVSIAKRLDLQLQRYQSAACACGECGEAATRSETVAMEVLQYCQATVAADQVPPGPCPKGSSALDYFLGLESKSGSGNAKASTLAKPSDDGNEFEKIAQPLCVPPESSNLARLLTASWYARRAVRQPRFCGPLPK